MVQPSAALNIMNKIKFFSISAFFLVSAGIIAVCSLRSPDAEKATEFRPEIIHSEVFNQSGISILSKGNSRKSVLDGIAIQANIIIDYSNLSSEKLSQIIYVDINNTTLETALSIALNDIEFYSQLSFDKTSGQHYISSVFFKPKSELGTIKQFTDNKTVAIEESITKNRDSDNPQEDPPSIDASPEERKLKKDMFSHLDTQSRLELLTEMSPVGADLQHIRNALLNDSDPNVRAAAAKRLAFSENYSATNSLLSALSDQDETVVIEAINSLVQLGDASVLPVIEEKVFSPSDNVKISLARAKERFNRPIGMDSDNH